MSSYEFTYWIAFYGLEPFGHARDEYHTALICYTIAKTQGSKKVKVQDFINDWYGDHKSNSNMSEIKSYFKGLAAAEKKKNKKNHT